MLAHSSGALPTPNLTEDQPEEPDSSSTSSSLFVTAADDEMRITPEIATNSSSVSKNKTPDKKPFLGRHRRCHSLTNTRSSTLTSSWNASSFASATDATETGKPLFSGFFSRKMNNRNARSTLRGEVGGGSSSGSRRILSRTRFRDPCYDYNDDDLEPGRETAEAEDERDPVMALLRARATHRVRFSLEQTQPDQLYTQTQTEQKQPNSSSPSTSSEAAIPNTSLLKRSNSSERVPPATFRTMIDAYSRSPSPPPSPLSSSSIQKFVHSALFGRRRSPDFDAEVAKIDMAWEKPALPKTTTTTTRGVANNKVNNRKQESSNRQEKKKNSSPSSFFSFQESKEIRSQVNKLLNKAFRAHHVHFRYEYAVKCCMKALEILKTARYPEDHAIVLKTLRSLNAAHHALSSLENSANIVKMGIKYEDSGEFVRALKMYTIAYRIRRDNLSPNHPSLIVLLNMLGGIQVKRDELEEAMEIFELALNEEDEEEDNDEEEDEVSENADENNRKDNGLSDRENAKRDQRRQGQQQNQQFQEQSISSGNTSFGGSSNRKKNGGGGSSKNFLAKSVTYREMGIIYERWGDTEEALRMYHKSLDCIAEYKGINKNEENRQYQKTAKMAQQSSCVGASPQDEKERQQTQGRDLINNSELKRVNGGCLSPQSPPPSEEEILLDLESVQLSRSFTKHTAVCKSNKDEENEGGMELFIGSGAGSGVHRRHHRPVGNAGSGVGDGSSSCSTAGSTGSSQSGGSGDSRKQRRAPSSSSMPSSTPIVASTCYDIYFQEGCKGKKKKKHGHQDERNSSKNKNKNAGFTKFKKNSASSSSSSLQSTSSSPSYSSVNVDVAMTLHQIGQLHRAEGEYNLALAAYSAALRGMREALGHHHTNVAAILGNIGNLQKEMGDLNAAFETYQQVLAIESYRLGLSHPDVAVTLHNIATIDAARGNYEAALTLYGQVLNLQKKLFGEDHLSLAVTSACMGDVYERIGKIDQAIEALEEALRIKMSALGRHSLEVARILHKLGKLSFQNGEVSVADSHLSRAVLIYRLNRLRTDDAWLVEAHRDVADIDAAIAMGLGRGAEQFEC